MPTIQVISQNKAARKEERRVGDGAELVQKEYKRNVANPCWK